MVPPQPEAGLAFSPGENFGQNPSLPNSKAIPRECHEGSGPHQEAVALNGSLWAFVCFLLFCFVSVFFLFLTEMSGCLWPLGEALVL